MKRNEEAVSNLSSTIINDMQQIIDAAQNRAIQSVDFERVRMYWKIGQRIVTEEQASVDRADYGKQLLKGLGKHQSSEFGSGFSERNLRYARKFYQTYPIWNAVRAELGWFQYRLLSAVSDGDKRHFYEVETIKNHWTGRALQRQIESLLFERLQLSTNKENVLAIANEARIPAKPKDIIKDPTVLEFLGLKSESSYRESDLENALIEHLQEFLLELGNGFSFVARQKRITLDDDDFYVDLVFYNRLLKAHVLFEIKTHRLTHEDLGQLQIYVNYYDRVEKLEDESKTIGVLLCTAKNDELVKFALPENNETIIASKYQFVLPTEAELLEQINEVEKELQE